MIGLILWVIVILFIANAACPGIIWVALGIFVGIIVLYIVFTILSDKFIDNK